MEHNKILKNITLIGLILVISGTLLSWININFLSLSIIGVFLMAYASFEIFFTFRKEIKHFEMVCSTCKQKYICDIQVCHVVNTGCRLYMAE